MAHSYSKRREKKVHKMTRSGIVEQNVVTGEIKNISKRECELNLRMDHSTEQPILAEKDLEIRNGSQIQQHEQPQKKQQRHYNQQLSNWTTEATSKTNNMPDNTEVIPPSSGNITDIGRTSQANDFSTGNKKEEYSSFLETPVADDSIADMKERLHFSSHTKQAKQLKSVVKTTNTDKSKFVPETKDISNFKVEKDDKLQYSKNSKVNISSKKCKPVKKRQYNKVGYQEFVSDNEAQMNKRKTSLKFESLEQDLKIYDPSNAVQQEHQIRREEFNQEKTETENLVISENSQPLFDTGKLQIKESKLKDAPTPIQTKSRKMSRKRKKQMKAKAARAEKKLKQNSPELLSTLGIGESQLEKPPINIAETASSLQKNTGKLNFDDTEKNKTTHILPQKISLSFQPKRDNPDMVKSPLGNKKETAEKPIKSSKLEFTDEEKQTKTNTKLERLSKKTDTKLERLSKKTEYYNDKLKKAQDKLPSVKKKTKVRIFDEAKGKAKTKLAFEKEILPPKPYKPSFKPIDLTKRGTGKLIQLGVGKLHQKVYEVEHENVGVQAGHHAERAAETAYHSGKRVIRHAFRYFRSRPYRTVKKLEKKALQANIKYSYQKLLHENPKLKSNLFSRFMQKRKIKQQYAQAARNVKRTGEVVKKTGIMAEGATKTVAAVVNKHPAAIVIILLILLLVFFMSSVFSAISSFAGTGMSAILASSYLAEDIEIDIAELNYTEWEADLLMKINCAEQDYPGYDEYHYQVDNIGHNPYELIAFLTAKYQAYEYSDIQTILQEIFNQQYILSIEDCVETRYYKDADGELIPYEWRVLSINLTSRSFTEIIMPQLDTDQTEIYNLLMQTKGNRQYVDSPFEFNWLPNVSSHYGYRIHPLTGAKDYHLGVDIAVPVGTDIKAGFDGTVAFAGYAGDYGYAVIIENDKGVTAKYAHCDSLSVSNSQEVKRGDVIAKSGNSGMSTGPHLHMEVLKDSQYLNPLYFAVTNDTGFVSPEYGYAGFPMGDGTYSALIKEAEKHLGKKYVFGANGPNNFDCSSFVCWSLTHSGVKDVARTTAQGLYNMSTPVSPTDARPGDLIFFHSTYSTSNTVTHVGIYVGSGYMIHAGDPIQYTSINTNYWQNHFYAFGRLN